VALTVPIARSVTITSTIRCARRLLSAPRVFEPHHVRIDMLPGEADLTRDGIPRVFDGVLDAPTYRFLRGQENNPDKSAALSPGVPRVLEFAPLKIEPVELPVEAWEPQRRAWIAEAHLAAARKKITAAEAKLGPARDKLAAAEKHAAALLAKMKTETPAPIEEPAKPAVETATITEKFATLDEKRWKLFGGEWVHEKGRLEQKRDGATRAALRLIEAAPRDFDATLRFRRKSPPRANRSKERFSRSSSRASSMPSFREPSGVRRVFSRRAKTIRPFRFRR
jgi:hypothetical protein